MRHVILLDSKISQDDYEAWKKEDTAFWRKYADITPGYAVLRYDFSDYPTYIDSDGDIRPTEQYLQSLTDFVVSIYGEFAVDFIVVAIHEDNWKSDPKGPGGIWGTNYSYKFGKQTLQYCRWDKDNPANTFGTLYHERHHSLDALIAQEIGIRVEPLLGVPMYRYDRCITHGKCEPWRYIRHKENTASIKKMAPLLRKTFGERRQKERDQFDQVKTIRGAFNLLRYLLRMQKNIKDGVNN